MRIALVCGDGLPVSGLLTVFRNVVSIGAVSGHLKTPITADLGYSWRPDKAAFFPCGPDAHYDPDFLTVQVSAASGSATVAGDLLSLRTAVADYATLTAEQRTALAPRIEALAAPYEAYFTKWFSQEDVDWVIAVNMTLSDAVPVTLALHRAAAWRWSGRPGGVVFWDHDLFGSYAVREAGQRVYPPAPNPVTPVPGSHPCHIWAVVTEDLAKEAAGYPSCALPIVVPNVLPTVPGPGLSSRQREYLARRCLDSTRPMILAPVRLFHVKGVEISVELLRHVHAVCGQRSLPLPYLLIFGSLDEEPGYARSVLDAVDRTGMAEAVHFLDGVPLISHRDTTGNWMLDEADLLGICASTGGGVFFTPNCPDVESVGLGPALAAIACVPSAVTDFTALHSVYGPDFRFTIVGPDPGLHAAAEDFVDLLAGNKFGDTRVRAALRRNQELVLARFPDQPWRELLDRMAASLERGRRDGTAA